MGTGSLAAVVAIKEYLQQHKSSGTVRYYGCPAEEGGGGKVFMVREGLFDYVDFALSWHPGHYPAATTMSFLATIPPISPLKVEAPMQQLRLTLDEVHWMLSN